MTDHLTDTELDALDRLTATLPRGPYVTRSGAVYAQRHSLDLDELVAMGTNIAAAWVAAMLLAAPRLTATVRELRARLDQAERERDEARAWVRRMTSTQRVLTCAFCGEAYPPGTPESNNEALTAHVHVCAKHPMREAERARDEALSGESAAAVELRGALDAVAKLSAALAGEQARREEAERLYRDANAAADRWLDECATRAERAERAERERDEALAALAAAEMERDVAWVRACDTNDGVANINRGLGLRDKHKAWAIVLLAQGTGSTATDADIAAAIRAARGAK